MMSCRAKKKSTAESADYQRNISEVFAYLECSRKPTHELAKLRAWRVVKRHPGSGPADMADEEHSRNMGYRDGGMRVKHEEHQVT